MTALLGHNNDLRFVIYYKYSYANVRRYFLFRQTSPLTRANKISENINLRSVNEVPEEYRAVFRSFPYFNIVQSRIFEEVLYTDKPLVVSAPTGSGKTIIFELAIVRLLKVLQNENLPDIKDVKVIYVAPLKAICEERFIEWCKKFSNFNLNCTSITGDTEHANLKDLLKYNLIITTPEKWDSLTRNWRENKDLVASIKLFLIDEIHLLNEESRGATLETIICRMKTIQNSIFHSTLEMKENGTRFVAVSATIPNIEDIAQFLSTADNKAIFHSFGEEMRPVKLNKIVQGYTTDERNFFKFDLMLNYKLNHFILQYSEGKPTIIFCSTRKSVEMTSKHIAQNITVKMDNEQKVLLKKATDQLSDKKAKEYLVHGVAFHHAGMLIESRNIIEELFRNGDLPILVTTSTLAMGVNLPAHLVIIKSTKCFMNGEYRDYNEGTLLQMIGRAGRPQFDVSATAVILTTLKDKSKYENMIGRSQPIESNLHRHLTEHLNAEICLRSITDLGIAMQWIFSTFLYIRARKVPRHYGLQLGLSETKLDNKLLEMCQIEINKLNTAGMITMNSEVCLEPTQLGAIMAQYYIAFETMKLFTTIQGGEVLSQLLVLVSKCHEFSALFLRVNEKRTLNLLNSCKNSGTIRFPFNGKITTLDMKVNCIIQAVFGCLQISDHSLLNEAMKIMRIGERVCTCLTKFLETRKKCFSALLNSYILSKCFRARIWENSKHVCQQLTGIGPVLSNLLVNAGKTDFKSILEDNPRNLERILKRKPPFGDSIQSQIKYYPIYKMNLQKKDNETNCSLLIKIDLLNVENLKENSTLNDSSKMILLVGDDDNNILCHEKFDLAFMRENPEVEREVFFQKEVKELFAHFISEDMVGLDCVETFPKKVENVICQPEKPKRNYKKRNPQQIDDNSSTVQGKLQKKPSNSTNNVQKCITNFFPAVKNSSSNTITPSVEEKENIFNNIKTALDDGATKQYLKFKCYLNILEPSEENVVPEKAPQSINHLKENNNHLNVNADKDLENQIKELGDIEIDADKRCDFKELDKIEIEELLQDLNDTDCKDVDDVDLLNTSEECLENVPVSSIVDNGDVLDLINDVSLERLTEKYSAGKEVLVDQFSLETTNEFVEDNGDELIHNNDNALVEMNDYEFVEDYSDASEQSGEEFAKTNNEFIDCGNREVVKNKDCAQINNFLACAKMAELSDDGDLNSVQRYFNDFSEEENDETAIEIVEKPQNLNRIQILQNISIMNDVVKSKATDNSPKLLTNVKENNSTKIAKNGPNLHLQLSDNQLKPIKKKLESKSSTKTAETQSILSDSVNKFRNKFYSKIAKQSSTNSKHTTENIPISGNASENKSIELDLSKFRQTKPKSLKHENNSSRNKTKHFEQNVIASELSERKTVKRNSENIVSKKEYALADSTFDEDVKYEVVEILVPEKRSKVSSDEDAPPKSLSWRSPLVYSPEIKFSPNLTTQNYITMQQDRYESVDFKKRDATLNYGNQDTSKHSQFVTQTEATKTSLTSNSRVSLSNKYKSLPPITDKQVQSTQIEKSQYDNVTSKKIGHKSTHYKCFNDDFISDSVLNFFGQGSTSNSHNNSTVSNQKCFISDPTNTSINSSNSAKPTKCTTSLDITSFYEKTLHDNNDTKLFNQNKAIQIEPKSIESIESNWFEDGEDLFNEPAIIDNIYEDVNQQVSQNRTTDNFNLVNRDLNKLSSFWDEKFQGEVASRNSSENSSCDEELLMASRLNRFENRQPDDDLLYQRYLRLKTDNSNYEEFDNGSNNFPSTSRIMETCDNVSILNDSIPAISSTMLSHQRGFGDMNYFGEYNTSQSVPFNNQEVQRNNYYDDYCHSNYDNIMSKNRHYFSQNVPINENYERVRSSSSQNYQNSVNDSLNNFNGFNHNNNPVNHNFRYNNTKSYASQRFEPYYNRERFESRNQTNNSNRFEAFDNLNLSSQRMKHFGSQNMPNSDFGRFANDHSSQRFEDVNHFGLQPSEFYESNSYNFNTVRSSHHDSTYTSKYFDKELSNYSKSESDHFSGEMPYRVSQFQNVYISPEEFENRKLTDGKLFILNNYFNSLENL